MNPFLAKAMIEARKGLKAREVPVGAVLVAGDQVIAKAHNLRETRQSPLGHAEIIAIERASKKLGTWRLNRLELYVTLEPCPMCAAALQQARIGAVFFGAADPKGGALSLGINLNQNPKLNHRFEITQINTPECGEILTEFFRAKRRNRSLR